MIVLITGCRSGFGLLSALELARRGHTVYAGVRQLAHASALKEAAGALDVRPIALDVTRPEQREAAVAQILAEQGRLDALVNNAGQGLHGFLDQIEEDELRELFEVNVFAVWGMTRAALPALRDARGIVVNVGSMSGRMALPSFGAYAATKFALEGMSEAWRHELRGAGVRLALLEPGPYRTELFGRNRRLARRALDPAHPSTSAMLAVERAAARMDRRAGDPAEVARRVADLVEHPAPPLRHPIGPLVRLRLLVRALLPYRWWEFLLARALATK